MGRLPASWAALHPRSSKTHRPVVRAAIMSRAGFVAIVGLPNVGKSTLMNHVLGQKITIASPRPQTTRNRILGVHTFAGGQLVMVDTPGLHRPGGRRRSELNRYMVEEALAA